MRGKTKKEKKNDNHGIRTHADKSKGLAIPRLNHSAKLSFVLHFKQILSKKNFSFIFVYFQEYSLMKTSKINKNPCLKTNYIIQNEFILIYVHILNMLLLNLEITT